MNYPESQQILDKIKSSQKILLNCHHNPDADSVGSALSMYLVLKEMGKKVKILCPNEVPSSLKFLPNADAVEKIDYSTFDCSAHDLFITLDSASWNRVSGSDHIDQPEIELINIDHHITNQEFGQINLNLPDLSSNSEILFNLFADWNIEITQEIATCLLTGIIGDTGAFRYAVANADTLKAGMSLMEKGANKQQIVLNLYQSYPENYLRIWGEALRTAIVDKENKLAYASVPLEIYEKYGKPRGAKSELAGMLFQSFEGTDFGFLLLEEEKGMISVSFRSRTGYDVARLASKLNGGGHQWASAGRINGMSLDKALEKILQAVKELNDN